MTAVKHWADTPHAAIHDQQSCGHRNPRNGHRCTQPAHHDGPHMWAWQHLPTAHGLPGRIRDTWETT